MSQAVLNLLQYLPTKQSLAQLNDAALCAKKLRDKIDSFAELIKAAYQEGRSHLYLAESQYILQSNDPLSPPILIDFVYGDTMSCVASLFEELITNMDDIGYTVENVSAYVLNYSETWETVDPDDLVVVDSDRYNEYVQSNKRRTVSKTIAPKTIYKVNLI